jgi:predicted transcriptional regulator
MKQPFFCLMLLFFATTLVSQAQQDPRISSFLAAKKPMNAAEVNKYLDQLFPEWQLSKMKNLCAIVSGRMKDNSPEGGYKYLYQRRIYEAAKVDKSADSKEVIARKISSMWAACEQLDLLKCNSTQFDVMEGSLFKICSIVPIY